MRKVDVVVLGAGISGSTAAALLSRKGYQVMILSQDAGTKNHLPESWIYHSLHSIRNLGCEEKILAALKRQSRCCFCSADGSRSIEITTTDAQKGMEEGDLVQVDRNSFDQALLRSAAESGADFFPMSAINSCEISSSEVKTSFSREGKSHEVVSSYIIDATGKSGFLSNHLKLPTREEKLDARIACFSHFEINQAVINEVRIVSIKDGYLFCIPISDQRFSIGCVLSEQAPCLPASPEKIFAYAISLSPYVMEWLEKAERVLPVILAKNHQKICLEPAGPCYRLVGDAAAFLDPFFCPGIDFAFFSAEQAVLSIEDRAPLKYQNAIANWLEESKEIVYRKIEQSEWGSILRLFADPHLPFAVPLMLTQAFTQIADRNVSFSEGMRTARRAYEISSR